MNIKQSILAALAYHDIFDYPLYEEEIKLYLTSPLKSTRSFNSALKQLIKENKIGNAKKLYFLHGKQKNVLMRCKRKIYSNLKRSRAELFLTIIKRVPGVKLVAITGALAMKNSTKNDDIDLLIVTSQNKLWTTRFILNIALFPFKRSPKSKKQNNKACLNIFIDESNLTIPDQNLYIAHEIAQMKPIWDRGNTYQKFIRSNIWVRQYLPNWKPEARGEILARKHIFKLIYYMLHVTCYLLPLEKFTKSFQLSYMRTKITIEKITDTQLFFHPKKTQTIILKKYKIKLKSIIY
ncbi:MAG: hypothetical protein UU23_C0002G0027 [Candidatus Curtissbacteria bacterium GW2011_GWA1_40_9]|uniref:Polymerase nucleotidyl transferase domain-containing protein n=1 Tax=Candidatus Curtissbacteria bacterium GW2011_GWA1_40_9 TaxID=1618408 RepID=A0A0G0W1M8_9BACT|nr:MAG: hypothetical protein UU23_C0002G0027 [Candidatus Curtissbacteria bacterium GW2011_GWA1_40_9]